MSHEFCEATVAADPPCTSWIQSGHPWHGCEKHPGHHSRVHVCRCGLEWSSYRRRSK